MIIVSVDDTAHTVWLFSANEGPDEMVGVSKKRPDF